MNRAVIIYAVAATVISFVIALLLLALLVQRRRQRAMLLVAIAQEEAARRRRKRKKAGLRRWQIDHTCPQAILASISSTATAPAIYSEHSYPDFFASCINSLYQSGALQHHHHQHHHHHQQLDSELTSPTTRSNHSRKPSEGKPSEDGTSASAPDPTTYPPISTRPTRLVSYVATIPSEQQMCVICLDHLKLAEHIRCLPCSHVYHSNCIKLWLRRKNSCPCCAAKVVKRRRKSSRHSPSTQFPNENQPVHHSLDNNTPAQHNSSVSNNPEPVTPRLQDRCEPVSLDVHRLTPKNSIPFRVAPTQSGAVAGAGTGSFVTFTSNAGAGVGAVDMRDDDSSDQIHSELSSHADADEPSASELLSQLRNALRTDGSMFSFETSTGSFDAGFEEQMIELSDIGHLGDASGIDDDDEEMVTPREIDVGIDV